MTSSFGKRKFAGPTIAEKRKVVPEPPKHGRKAKPKVYVLRTVETTVMEHEYVNRYPSKAARDQAKADITKKARASVIERRQYDWYRHYDRSFVFEESEE
jgi:hypothetical protein